MIRNSTELIRIFVASPGDLDVERDAVGAAVEELNLGLAPSLGMRLELIRWETHTTPELGSDPQDIVNRQVGDDFEVFLGILWTRFGTPTPRAESGTLEEFERAKARWLEQPESVSVKFYFKEEPISPTDIDPEQLAKVQGFRKELSSTAIYGIFISADDLARLVRVHLTKYLTRDRLAGSRSIAIAVGEPSVQPLGRSHAADETPDDSSEEVLETVDVDEGLLDLVERAGEGFNGVREVLGSMTDGMESLTESIQEATSGIQEAKKNGEVDYKEAKKVVNHFSGRVNTIAARFEADVLVFREKFAGAMDAFIKATEVSVDFGPEAIDAIRQNRKSVVKLGSQSQSALEMVDSLRTSTDELPRVTTQFNRARKRLGTVLAAIHREFSNANGLVHETVGVVDQTLAQFEVPGESGS